MRQKEEEILRELANCVIDGDYESVKKVAEKALRRKVDPILAIEEGLAKGVRVVGESFGRGELFLPDLVQAAEAMKAGIAVLKRKIPKGRERRTLGTVVMGTVEGDIHDIGKNIVAAMLESNGFTVHDLGADVSSEKFMETVEEVKPDILGMSALLTTTLPNMNKVIRQLEKAGLRDRLKVMVGGAPVTKEWANKIGADAYGSDAIEAVVKAKELLKPND